MNVRPLTRDDAQAVLELWNRAAPFDPVNARLLEEKIWGDPDFNPRLAQVGQQHGELVALIVGVVRAAAPTRTGYIKLLAVDPAHQRQRNGSQLLELVEGALLEQGATEIRIAESAPNYLTPGVDQRLPETLSFFEGHGYEPFAEAHNLSVDLAIEDFHTQQAEQDLRAQGIQVRRATANDRPALVTFLQAHWPAWQAESGCAYANKPISLHLGWVDETVIGFAAYHGNNVGTGWFGPMGTDPTYRGRGVGAVLLRRCLRDLKDQGLGAAIIPWAAHLGFYEQHAVAKRNRKFQRFRKWVNAHA